MFGRDPLKCLLDQKPGGEGGEGGKEGISGLGGLAWEDDDGGKFRQISEAATGCGGQASYKRTNWHFRWRWRKRSTLSISSKKKRIVSPQKKHPPQIKSRFRSRFTSKLQWK